MRHRVASQLPRNNRETPVSRTTLFFLPPRASLLPSLLAAAGTLVVQRGEPLRRTVVTCFFVCRCFALDAMRNLLVSVLLWHFVFTLLPPPHTRRPVGAFNMGRSIRLLSCGVFLMMIVSRCKCRPHLGNLFLASSPLATLLLPIQEVNNFIQWSTQDTGNKIRTLTSPTITKKPRTSTNFDQEPCRDA